MPDLTPTPAPTSDTGVVTLPAPAPTPAPLYNADGSAPTPQSPAAEPSPHQATPPVEGASEAPAAEVPGDQSPLGQKLDAEGKPVEEAKPAPTPVDPASYTDFTVPPTIAPDEKGMGLFKDTAAKAGLSQEQAQSILDVYTSQMEAIQATHTEMINGWKAEIQADPVLSKTAEVTTTFGRALDQYGTPEVRAAFDLTGAGWNPHILRFIHKMASALNEGSPVLSGTPAPTKPATLGGRLYNS